MASDDLDIPQIVVGGVPDHDTSSPSPAISSIQSPPGSFRFPTSSYTDNRGLLRNSLDPLGSPAPPSNNCPLPPVPFPTPNPDSRHSPRSFLWSNSTYDNVSREHDAEFNSSPLRSVHSNVTSKLPFPTITHLHNTAVDAAPGPRHSPAPVTTFLKQIMHRLRRSRGTDSGSRNDGLKGNNFKCKGAEPACPAENESPTSAQTLPPVATDNSCVKSTDSSHLSCLSPPSYIIKSPPFSPTPTDPVPAETQGPQSRVLVLITICTVASLSLGIFRYFGMTRLKGIIR